MRLGRIGLGILAVAVALGGGGCGEGTPAPQAQGEVAGPVTTPRVAAFAREVQLGKSDFPGATVLPSGIGDEDDDFAVRFGNCVGSDLDPPTIGHFVSPTFYYSEGDEKAVFESQVEAAPTPYEAEALATLFGSKRGFSCFQRLAPHSLEASSSEDEEFHDVRVSRLSTPLPSTPNSFGFRFDTTEVRGDKERRVFIDEIGFALGPTQVTLVAAGTPTPVNQDIEARLMLSLYVRAWQADF
jgi:hypothetical protein